MIGTGAHAGPSWRGICVMIPANNGATCHLASCIGRVRASSKRPNRCTSRCESDCPQEADSVLIAGTGFRCVAILDALERDLQRPVA